MQRRIEKAKELLISTNTPIAELAMATGFSDQSHLTMAFRRAVGQSPARYRKSGK
jgi:AraC family transcriptional regulator